jgi:transposase
MQDINPEDIIVLDESGSNLAQTSDYARAEGGSRIKSPKPHNPGIRFSIVAAIAMTGVVAAMYTDSAINGDIFETFIRVHLLKELRPGNFVIMDNIHFHKQEMIRVLIESAGAKVVFLPPYSPDLSPIEKMWSKVKHIIKTHKPRTCSEFHHALFFALSSVTNEDIEGWYEECGYQVVA